MSEKARGGGRPTRASPSGTGRRARTTRPFGRPTRSTTPTRDPVTRMLEIRRGDARRHRGRAAHARRPARLRRRVPAPGERRSCAPPWKRARRSSSTSTIRLMHLPVDPARRVPRAVRSRRVGRLASWSSTATSASCSICSTSSPSATTPSWSSRATTGPRRCCCGAARPGFWEGSYFAGGEGNLRTPCIVRWPGHVAPGAVATTSCTSPTGSRRFWRRRHDAPADRVIDGVDQLDWLTGEFRVPTRRLPLLDGRRDLRRQVAQLQVRAGPPSLFHRPARPARVPAADQPPRRPPRARADNPAAHALLDRRPLQPDPGRVPLQRPTRAARPAGAALDHVPAPQSRPT